MAARDQSPTSQGRSLQPARRPRSITVDLGGRLDLAAISTFCDDVHVLLEAGGVDVVVCDVGGLVDPDLPTIDALARLQLAIRQHGGHIRLRSASCELRGLLTLVGLADAVPLEPR